MLALRGCVAVMVPPVPPAAPPPAPPPVPFEPPEAPPLPGAPPVAVAPPVLEAPPLPGAPPVAVAPPVLEAPPLPGAPPLPVAPPAPPDPGLPVDPAPELHPAARAKARESERSRAETGAQGRSFTTPLYHRRIPGWSTVGLGCTHRSLTEPRCRHPCARTTRRHHPAHGTQATAVGLPRVPGGFGPRGGADRPHWAGGGPKVGDGQG